jgi:hypothetical protein
VLLADVQPKRLVRRRRHALGESEELSFEFATVFMPTVSVFEVQAKLLAVEEELLAVLHRTKQRVLRNESAINSVLRSRYPLGISRPERREEGISSWESSSDGVDFRFLVIENMRQCGKVRVKSSTTAREWTHMLPRL